MSPSPVLSFLRDALRREPTGKGAGVAGPLPMSIVNFDQFVKQGASSGKFAVMSAVKAPLEMLVRPSADAASAFMMKLCRTALSLAVPAYDRSGRMPWESTPSSSAAMAATLARVRSPDAIACSSRALIGYCQVQ